MAVKCGNCKNYHDTAAGVRACYQGSGYGPVTATIKAEVDTQAAEAPATEKQLEYLKALLADRTGWADRVFFKESSLANGTPLTKREASYWIGKAKEVPAEPKPDGSPTPTGKTYMPEIEDGVYRNVAGQIFKVYHTVHGNNTQVAKRLVVHSEMDGTWTAEFVYEGRKGLKGLTAAMLLTQEEAAEFGKVYGFCVRCGRTLTREESIHVGYGATCAGHMGWWYPTKAELKELAKAKAS